MCCKAHTGKGDESFTSAPSHHLNWSIALFYKECKGGLSSYFSLFLSHPIPLTIMLNFSAFTIFNLPHCHFSISVAVISESDSLISKNALYFPYEKSISPPSFFRRICLKRVREAYRLCSLSFPKSTLFPEQYNLPAFLLVF